MESSGVLEMWTDASRLNSDHGGYVAVARSVIPGDWTVLGYGVKRAQEDVRNLELHGIKTALACLVPGARARADTAKGVLTPIRVTIWTDCQDALDEMKLFDGGPYIPSLLPEPEEGKGDNEDRRGQNPRVTEVTHRDLIREIFGQLRQLDACSVLAEVRWEKRCTSDGGKVADAMAGKAAFMAQGNAGYPHRRMWFQSSAEKCP